MPTKTTDTKQKSKFNPELKEQPLLIDIPENKSIIPNDEIIIKNKSENDGDSFFRNVLNKLFDSENISLKTEYLDIRENFAGTKLEFLSKYGNMPYMDEFLKLFERKRVSLKRKGRQEIIFALQQRQQEIEQANANKLKNVLGLE